MDKIVLLQVFFRAIFWAIFRAILQVSKKHIFLDSLDFIDSYPTCLLFPMSISSAAPPIALVIFFSFLLTSRAFLLTSFRSFLNTLNMVRACCCKSSSETPVPETPVDELKIRVAPRNNRKVRGSSESFIFQQFFSIDSKKVEFKS